MPAQGPDHLNMSPTRDESPDNIDTLKKQRLARAQNEIGAKVLTLAGFESRQKDIVESSFDKARKNKEKLPGKNNERRNFAYLSRLDSVIEKHGDTLEKRLWNASADNVIIKPENTPMHTGSNKNKPLEMMDKAESLALKIKNMPLIILLATNKELSVPGPII